MLSGAGSLVESDAHSAEALFASAGVAAALAALAWALGRGAEPVLRIRDALVVVVVGWLAMGGLGALPYFLEGTILRWHDAWFESVSGFTTTGSTILTDIEGLPRGLHIWRMATHWLGGIGIVVIFVALLPQLGVGAKHLFKSEVPGPITEGLRPKVQQTALALAGIYLALTLVEALLLATVGGLDVFQSVLHAMSTMATGGFSTQNGSVADFQSPAVEWIIVAFMYLAGVNFALYYGALTGRSWALIRDVEWRTYSLIVLVAGGVIAVAIYPLHGDVHDAVRASFFQVLAISTTTGFGTDDFELWPSWTLIVVLGLMVFGGSAGSTAGGMKLSRLVILAKSALNQLRQTVRPHTVSVVKLGRSAISQDVVLQTGAFAGLWLATAFAGGLYVAMLGVDLTTALTAALTCTANVGPGLGDVGPTDNFAAIPASGKVVLTFCMILGRLEFYTVLALLLPSTWRR